MIKISWHPMIKISLSSDITSLPSKMHSLPLFHSLPRPPHSLPRPLPSLPSLPRSQGPQQLQGSQAVETHWVRWKEIDVLFTVAVSLLPQERKGWRLITEACSHGLAEAQKLDQRAFQVADWLTWNCWHGRVARQSRVQFPVTDTDAGQKRQAQN